MLCAQKRPTTAEVHCAAESRMIAPLSVAPAPVDYFPRLTTQIWFAGRRGEGRPRTKAILVQSGENTQASGRGAEASPVRGVRRRVLPEATSVTQTLLSMA